MSTDQTTAPAGASEAQYRLLFERNPNPMWVFDLESLRFLAVNDAAVARYGYSREEFLAMTVLDIRPPEDVPAYLGVIGSLPGGFRELGTKRHRTRDGRILDVEAASHEIDFEGRPARLVTVTDVTVRRQAEAALKAANDRLEDEVRARVAELHESERRFRALIENAQDVVTILAVDGTIRYESPSVTRELGYTPEELVGRNVFAYVHEEDLPRAWEVFATVLEEAAPASGHVRFRHRDGSYRNLSFTAMSMVGERAVAGIVVNSRDVTEHERAEAERKRAGELLRSVIEEIPDALFLKDREGRHVLVNPAAARVVGRSVSEIIGRTDAEIFPPEVARTFVEWDRRVMESRQPATFEETISTPEGPRILLASKYPHLAPDGSVGGVLVIARDFTPARRMEEQLRQSQKLEAVGRLAGGIAHDFNNLLSIISSNAQLLLLDLAADHPMREELQDIKEACDRASGLTRQFLVFSRQQMLQPEVMDLNALIREFEKMLRRTLGEDIEFVTRLAPDLGRVKVDRGQIEQVLLNLAVNARDAMPGGGKLITETQNVELGELWAGQPKEGFQPGSYVMLTVSDTGCGIPQELRERIFEPFFTTKEVGKGTGLGLSIVYGIVRQSGGYIWVYSEEERGTTFKIYLPRAGQAAGEARLLAAPEDTRRRGGTILLVEDEQALRTVARKTLQRGGYTVLEAADGEEALHVAEEHTGKIDLLLTDVVMPRMSGRKVAERLREMEPGVHVIYTSGYTDMAIVHHGVVEGDGHFLPKPYAPGRLLGMVAEVLEVTQEE